MLACATSAPSAGGQVADPGSCTMISMPQADTCPRWSLDGPYRDLGYDGSARCHRGQRRYDRCEPLTNPPTTRGPRCQSVPRLPKRPDRTSRPPSSGRTRPVTVDSGQKQATGTWVSGGGVTLALGKLGGGAGRRSNGECRLMRFSGNARFPPHRSPQRGTRLGTMR